MDKTVQDDIAAIFSDDIEFIKEYYMPPNKKSKKATTAYLSRRKLESYLAARELRAYTSEYSE